MTVHVFVDETKNHGYLLAAAALTPADLSLARKQVKELLLRDQRRLHFTKEKDSRRREIISTLHAIGAEVIIYDASRHRDQKMARDACLERLVDDLAALGAQMLILERDDSVDAKDRQLIRTRVRAAGCEDTLRYEHKRAHEECLLAIPDAVAWCWAKKGDWRRRVEPLVSTVRQV